MVFQYRALWEHCGDEFVQSALMGSRVLNAAIVTASTGRIRYGIVHCRRPLPKEDNAVARI